MEKHWEDLARHLRLPDESRARIRTQLAAPPRPREAAVKKRPTPLCGLLIAAAAAAALAVTALALSPTLRDALRGALGAFPPYAQNMAGKGVSAVDQGIEVRVVSALADGNTIIVYFEAQDLTGDRMDGSTNTNTQLEWPKGQVEWRRGMTLLPEQIAYDAATKTALYRAGFVGDGVPAERLTVTLYGQVFSPGYHSFGSQEPLPDEVICKTLLRTETLPGGGVVLVPRQNPAPLPDDRMIISACGFGTDGRFHVQIGVEAGSEGYCWPTVESKAFLSGQRSFFYYEREGEAQFERDGMTYFDYTYRGERADLEDMAILLSIASVQKEGEIWGEWRLEAPLELQRATVISMENSGTEPAIGPEALRLFLSPISCTIENDPKDNGKTSLGYPLALFLADGSVISGLTCDSNYYSGRYATDHWTFPRPIDPAAVTAIAIGQWYVPLENAAAQPGHWLLERP